jgi:hypothetical protein
MKKKYIVFSMGAAVMLLLLSVQSVIATPDIPSDLEQQLKDFQQAHASEIATLEKYLESQVGKVPVATLSAQIQTLMISLTQAMNTIIGPYIRTPSPGVNGFWKTFLPGHPNNDECNPLWFYNGVCLALNKFWTNVAAYGVLVLNWLPATLVVLFLCLLPGIGAVIGAILGILLFLFWPVILAWLIDYVNWNDYGSVNYVFWPKDHPLRFSPKPELYAQEPNFPGPSWKHPELWWI